MSARDAGASSGSLAKAGPLAGSWVIQRGEKKVLEGGTSGAPPVSMAKRKLPGRPHAEQSQFPKGTQLGTTRRETDSERQ